MSDPRTMRSENYLSPDTLVQLSPFELRAKMIVEGVMSGMHRSPYQGMAVEFAQHRQYVAGDDTRHLDWKVYGRSDKLYTKQYQQETNLDVILMIDASASMGYGSLEVRKDWGGTKASEATKKWTKFDCATALAAALAYVCIHQQDRVGVCIFADGVHTLIRRSGAHTQWRSIVNTLSTEPVDEPTNFTKATDQVLGKITNRALFIILSDLFDDPENIRRALAKFRHRRHDVVLLHTLDRMEMQFDFTQPAPFLGLEGEGRLRIDPRALREPYLNALAKHIETISRTAVGFGFDYLRIDTHDPVGPTLAALLAHRQLVSKRVKTG